MRHDDERQFPALLAAAQSGDAAATDLLLRRSFTALYLAAERLLDQRLRHRVGVDDLVQLTLLEGARDLGGFTGDTHADFLAWLCGILRRNLLDAVKAHLSSRKRALALEVSLHQPTSADRNPAVVGDSIPDDQTSPSQRVARIEVVRRIAHCMNQLTDDERRAVQLSLTGHTAREIGAQLGRTESAATSLLKRAYEKLRELSENFRGQPLPAARVSNRARQPS